MHPQLGVDRFHSQDACKGRDSNRQIISALTTSPTVLEVYDWRRAKQLGEITSLSLLLSADFHGDSSMRLEV